MPLSKEQADELKKQLLSQIESFPKEQRDAAKAQIEAMDEEQLEQFLVQNNLLRAKSDDAGESGGCIFCSIIEGKTPSYKIDENKNAIAALDINPLSPGHAIIIPKNHEPIEKLPSNVLNLAKKIAKKLKSKLKPKPEEIKIETSEVAGHGMISVIPIYKDQKLERKKAEPEELEKLQEKLKTKTRAPRKKSSKPAKELPFAPVRIP